MTFLELPCYAQFSGYNWHGEGRSGQGSESGTMQLNPAPCVWARVPAESRGTALTPRAAFPVLLSHGEQFLHTVIHGLGELPHSVTLLFSGDRQALSTSVMSDTSTIPRLLESMGLIPSTATKRFLLCWALGDVGSYCHLASSDFTENNYIKSKVKQGSSA